MSDRLVYVSKGAGRSVAIRVWVTGLFLDTLACFALVTFALRVLGADPFVVIRVAGVAWLLGLVVVWLFLRRHPDKVGVALSIEEGQLFVRRGERLLIRTALDDLLDVRMDTESLVNVPGPESSGGGTTEESRIMLLFGGHPEPIHLTSDRTSYGECTEDFRRIKLFLRKRGWLPADERQACPSSAATLPRNER